LSRGAAATASSFVTGALGVGKGGQHMATQAAATIVGDIFKKHVLDLIPINNKASAPTAQTRNTGFWISKVGQSKSVNMAAPEMQWVPLGLGGII